MHGARWLRLYQRLGGLENSAWRAMRGLAGAIRGECLVGQTRLDRYTVADNGMGASVQAVSAAGGGILATTAAVAIQRPCAAHRREERDRYQD